MKWELKILKRRYFSVIAIILVLMMVLSTGCGVRINGEEHELFSVDKKENNLFEGVGKESLEAQTIEEDKLDGERLVLSTDAGNVTVEKSEASQIVIEAEKKVRGTSEKDKKTILENMNIELERNGKVMKLVVKTKDGEDFWDWKRDNFKSFQTTINLVILLPNGINGIEVNTGAGNIDINDISAELSINTGAGNIEIQGVSALENNNINTGAGNIEFHGEIYKVSSFIASSGVGNIDFIVPEDTKMSLDVSTGVGALSGSFIKTKNSKSKFYFVGHINGGGPSVKLNTGVGNIEADED